MKVFGLIVLLAASFYAWFFYYQPIKTNTLCEKPITYSIGYFDRRFGLSYKDFLAAVGEAEEVFEQALDRDLFRHSPDKSDLDINLVYDYRQEVTNTLSSLNEEVEENESAYNTLLRQFKSLKSKYDAGETAYDSEVEAFELKNAQYEAMVEEWNSSSRNSKKQFDALEDARSELQTELSRIKNLENNLNTQAREVNSMVDSLNALGRELNLDVEEFNTIGASRGETFTGGLYTTDGRSEKIDIFEFSSKDKLVRVLAHELGHALGLEHVDDPRAIMYYLNKGEAGTLTDADTDALKELCGI